MKLKRFAIAIMTAAGLLFPVSVALPAAAIDVSSGCASGPLSTTQVCGDLNTGKSGNDPVITVIKDVIEILSFVVGAAAIIGIVVNGLRMVVANGDAGAIAKARSGVILSLVGILVVIIAQTIVVFVLDKLKGNGL